MSQFNFIQAQGDYTKVAIDEAYDILMNLENPWTSDFTKVKKLKFIDRMIQYYTEEYEDYEKCGELSKLREVISSESKFKNKKHK